MKTVTARIVASLCLVAAMDAQAQATFLSDRYKSLDRATQTYDKVGDENEDSRDVRAFITQCSAVVPFRSFCGCLASKLPAGVTFQQYFAVLSRTKEQNSYQSLEPQVKQTYDAIPLVRDECAVATTAP